MNYRALEDLINILVKKSGYELDENTTLEDINLLNERKDKIQNKYEDLSKRIKEDKYFNGEEKNKDLDEKKYLEDALEILKNQKEGDLTEKEILSLEEQINISNFKIDNKNYRDVEKEDIDNILLKSLDVETNETAKIIEDKRKTASLIGLEILEDYKAGKSIKDIKDKLDMLVSIATSSYELTTDEIEKTNIFELMDEYSKRKADVFQKLEKNEYDNKFEKEDINKKCKYHQNRITALNDTISAIASRKEELEDLIKESKKIYKLTLNERRKKEEELNTYIVKFDSMTNLEVYKEEFNKYLDYLREEVAKNKYLENKYNKDVLSYNNEIRNLEINSKNVNASLLEEEKCLEILNDELEQLEENNINRINDEISYLSLSDRLEKLSNEQQYYYVNIDVIENEIKNLWNKEKDSSTSKKREKEKVEEVNTNMYDKENTPDEELKESNQDETELLNDIKEINIGENNIDDIIQELKLDDNKQETVFDDNNQESDNNESDNSSENEEELEFLE